MQVIAGLRGGNAPGARARRQARAWAGGRAPARTGPDRGRAPAYKVATGRRGGTGAGVGPRSER